MGWTGDTELCEFSIRQRGGLLVYRVTLGKMSKCLGAQKSRGGRLTCRVEMVMQKPKPQLVAGAVAAHRLVVLQSSETEANRIKVIGRKFYRQQFDWIWAGIYSWRSGNQNKSEQLFHYPSSSQQWLMALQNASFELFHQPLWINADWQRSVAQKPDGFTQSGREGDLKPKQDLILCLTVETMHSV